MKFALEETELHKSQIKELTEKLVQSIEDSNHKEKFTSEKYSHATKSPKELEEEPQKLKRRNRI